MPAMPASTPAAPQAVLTQLSTVTTIGSTIDPTNGDQNPYGLAIAPATVGAITAGDLIVCNFNDSANVQGNGTSLVDLKPVAGSKPTHLIADPTLKGCSAIAMGATGNPWIAAWSANDNPIYIPSSNSIKNVTSSSFSGPWGQAFSATSGPYGNGAFYESNAGNGSIVRIDLTSSGFAFDTIVTGLSFNGGAPGSILAPSGLTYQPNGDILYVVDSNTNRVIALKNVSSIPPGGITATDTASSLTFSGPAASSASVLFSGAPLNAPISAALLYDGSLVVGNTGDNNLVQISASGTLLATRSVDSGPAGAIFGIAASGTSAANQVIYFNDDNTNTVVSLSNGTGGTPAPGPTASPYARRRPGVR
jgi:hypothetical protein